MTMDFDGGDPAPNVTVSHDASLNITGDITILAWINKDTNADFDTIVSKDPTANDTPYYFMTRGDEIFFGFRNGGTFHEYETDATNLATGTWHHVAVVHDTVADTITLYLNGVSQAASVNAGAPLTTARPGNTQPVVIGEGDDDLFDGRIDDLRLYNRALFTAEVQTIFASRGIDGIVSGLAARWLLNEGAPGTTASGAGTAKDISGNGNDGTPGDTNFPTYEDSVLRFSRRAG